MTALETQLRLTDQLAACLTDRQNPDKIRHPVRDLLRQRIFGLAYGYEDDTDAVRVADDPMPKLAMGRDPLTRTSLASQPTLSWFENAKGPRALHRISRMLVATVMAQHAAGVKTGRSASRLT